MSKLSLVEMIEAVKANAANKAAVDLATETLDSQKKNLQRVAGSLTKISSLDAVIARDKNGYFLMTPFPADREDPFFTSLYVALDEVMRQYKGKRSSRDNRVSYTLSRRTHPRMASPLQIRKDWVSIDLNVSDLSQEFLSQSPKHREQNLSEYYHPAGEAGFRFEVVITDASAKAQSYIPLQTGNRVYFPGYQVHFILEANGVSIETYVTGANKGTPVGALAGRHIDTKVNQLYPTGLLPIGKVQIEIVNPGKHYKVVK